MNLIISYFKGKSDERNSELNTCLANNLNNKAFSSITVLVDQYPTELDQRCNKIYIHERPTFDLFFDFAKPNMWNVVCNSDIYFDDTIQLLNARHKDEFVALCRYEVLRNGSVQFLNRWDSQDTWCFYGRPKQTLRADFRQGVPGCDNALAKCAEVAGYRVTNPSLTIKTYHLHNSGERNYTSHDKVPEPYKLLTPHK